MHLQVVSLRPSRQFITRFWDSCSRLHVWCVCSRAPLAQSRSEDVPRRLTAAGLLALAQRLEVVGVPLTAAVEELLARAAEEGVPRDGRLAGPLLDGQAADIASHTGHRVTAVNLAVLGLVAEGGQPADLGA